MIATRPECDVAVRGAAMPCTTTILVVVVLTMPRCSIYWLQSGDLAPVSTTGRAPLLCSVK